MTFRHWRREIAHALGWSALYCAIHAAPPADGFTVGYYALVALGLLAWAQKLTKEEA